MAVRILLFITRLLIADTRNRAAARFLARLKPYIVINPRIEINPEVSIKSPF
jgi:hypothetical protein